MFWFIFDHYLLLIGIAAADNHGTKLTNRSINVAWQQALILFDYI